MTEENIFSALGKYNLARDENYLTEAFVFLLNSLLLRDRPIGIEMLTMLCVQNQDFSFGADEEVTVTTQEVTDQGIPDIKVSSPDKEIYIEVKHHSPLGYRQMARYSIALDSSPKSVRRVVLLTRFLVDFEDEEERPYKHVRWVEVDSWLEAVKPQHPVSMYLVESFRAFLKEKQMTMQRVGWEYINGVPALNSLIEMIEAALQNASIPIKKSPGWEFKGFNLQDMQFWCGIFYDDPLAVVFEIQNKRGFDSGLIEETGYPMRETKTQIWFRFDLEARHFFSLDREQQLNELTDFMKRAYSDVQQMRIPDE